MSQEKTYLGPELRIEGTIECVNDIEVHGEVIGSIFCVNDVLINGFVQGEISGRDITIRNQFLGSNLHATGNVAIEDSTDFQGNIEAKNLRMDGYCIGDIQVEDAVQVGSKALIKGNITASRLNVDEGAKITGIVNIIRG